MNEFFSKGVVLSSKKINNDDLFVSVFTPKFGKIEAKAVGARKISSKLVAHLQPLNFIKTRFIDRKKAGNGFIIVDSVSDEEFSKFKTTNKAEMLPILEFLDRFSFSLNEDENIWNFIKGILTKEKEKKETNTRKDFLSLLGFFVDAKKCDRCGNFLFEKFAVSDKEGIFCRNCVCQFENSFVLLF